MSMSPNIIRTNLPVTNANAVELRVPRPNQTIPMEYPSMAPRTDEFSSSFRYTYQSGFLSILYAIGPFPLKLWEKQVRNGYVKRLSDSDIHSLAIEIMSPNAGTTFITTPINPTESLGIRLPMIVFIIKNLKRLFSFEIQIVDETKVRRRFSISNTHPGVKIKPFSCNVPLKLDDGWNQVSLNLGEMTRKAFAQTYKETARIQIHANCRIRRVYFCDRIYSEHEVPLDFKLFLINTGPKGGSDINANAAIGGESRQPLMLMPGGASFPHSYFSTPNIPN